MQGERQRFSSDTGSEASHGDNYKEGRQGGKGLRGSYVGVTTEESALNAALQRITQLSPPHTSSVVPKPLSSSSSSSNSNNPLVLYKGDNIYGTTVSKSFRRIDGRSISVR